MMKNRIYLAYLLRLWRDHPESRWQAVLVNARTGEQLTFTTMKALTRFLADQTADLLHPIEAKQEIT